MAGLLGNGPSRHFKIFREEFPAIFRFNGKLYREPGAGMHEWVEITEEQAEPWLSARRIEGADIKSISLDKEPNAFDETIQIVQRSNADIPPRRW